MNPRKALIAVIRNPKGVRFQELMSLAHAFGFVEVRQRGSHHILKHRSVGAQLNLQNEKGYAKPYQVRQLLSLVERYGLELTE